LEEEKRQEGPEVLLLVRDSEGNLVNTVKGTNQKGFNRANWELDYTGRGGEKLTTQGSGGGCSRNTMATPGTYTVTLVTHEDGILTELAPAKEFEVVPLKEKALEGKLKDEINAFRADFDLFMQDLTATNTVLDRSIRQIDAMSRAFLKANRQPAELRLQIAGVRAELMEIQEIMSGSEAKNEIGEKNDPTPNEGAFIGRVALSTTYGPTENHKAAFTRAKNQLTDVKAQLGTIVDDKLPSIQEELKKIGAPWIEGQGLIEN
jgi:hypothetical protein